MNQEQNCAEFTTGSRKGLKAVTVPEDLHRTFLSAQEYVHSYFANRREDPQQGLFEISGERYILIRAASLSKEFFELVTSLYQDRGLKEARAVASAFLFDMAHSIGKADARSFFEKMGVTDPVDRFSAGPLHFAYSGWAIVDVFGESNPTPDENYYLIYDHCFSFEADSWLERGIRTDFPVCVMNAGYSSGWCEESFGIPLVAAEVECRAKGDDRCRFIMAPPTRIKSHVARYTERPSSGPVRLSRPEIPEFFQRKRLEDELRKSKEFTASLIQTSPAFFVAIGADGRTLLMNAAMLQALGYERKEVIGKSYLETFVPHAERPLLKQIFQEPRGEEGSGPVHEGRMVTKGGEELFVEWHSRHVFNAEKELEYFFALGIDVTKRKQAETELRRHRDHLEDLVAERTERLRGINEQLHREIVERKSAQEALEKSETMLQAIFDQTFQLIAVLRLDGTVVRVNKTAMNLVGTSEEEIAGRPFWETPWWTHSPKDRRRLQQGIEKAAQGSLFRFEARHLTAEDTWMHVDFSLKPVRGPNGDIALLIAEGRDITDLREAMSGLREREEELETQSRHLEEANIALKVLLRQMEEKQREDQESILINIKQLVIPYLSRLKAEALRGNQKALVSTLESNLKSITSPLLNKLSSSFLDLTPMEIRIAHLVKEGLRSKEIAELLGTSLNTIASHRYKIRTKLGLKKNGANLRSYLLSLEE